MCERFDNWRTNLRPTLRTKLEPAVSLLQANKRGPHKTVFFPDGQRYQGEWLNNLRHGKGSQFYKNGSKYEGNWKEGMRHGLGILWNCDSKRFRVKYSGEWRDDIPHGMGTHYDEHGNVYEGNWVTGQRSGLGKMTYESGSVDIPSDIYEGEWQSDTRHGRGTMTYAQQNVYEGHWENNVRKGTGSMFFVSKGTRFDGIWFNDVPKTGSYSELETSGPSTLPVLELQNPESVLEKALT